MLRIRMMKIVHLLENNSFKDVKDIILDRKNRKALNALIDLGCVKPLRDWGGEILDLELLNHSVIYVLERHEVWLNRLYGFIAGVVTTAAGELIAYVIFEML